MSTFTKEFTKEQLIEQAKKNIEVLRGAAERIPGASDAAVIHLKLAEITLASLEADAVCYLTWHQGFRAPDDCEEYVVEAKPGDKSCDGSPAFPVYAAPPATVSVPDEDLLHMAASAIEDLIGTEDRSGAGVWADVPAKLRRAALLQGADRPQNEPQNIPENIPATQFKPVADLYGLTSPTGGETSFTFDAVEARDFIDGGWSCQEYVELGRFQEAMLQNGNSPAQSDCCPEQNYIAPAQDSDSPVIPDGWVMVPVEPTEHMIVEGFESEPDEFFSDAEVWEAYDAMSGCQQAAHRAKLCWAAMISAAPKLE
ncbi:hypothetical protein [Enterobacter roggenkampii]|uniref:hypothetical protein n=1 Tax=Enterobacter roggenkampii TaxID=1812935 RepID=UPI0038902297